MIAMHRSLGEGRSGPLGRIDSCGTTPLQTAPAGVALRYFGSFALVLFESGWCRYRDALGRSRVLEGGDVVLVLPRFGHRYDAHPESPEPPRHTFVVFEGPMPELWERTGWISPEAALMPKALRPSARYELTDLLEGVDAVDEMIRLQRLLHRLLTSGREPDPEAQWLAEAQRLLAGGEGRSLPLEDVARAMQQSYAAFRRRFREAAGVSPARYRATQTIAQAKQLIATTDLSDKEIAFELGFTYPHHFSRRFTQIVGETPTAFRRHLTRNPTEALRPAPNL